MREVGSEFLSLVAQTDGIEHRLRLVDDVGEGIVMPQHAPAVPARLRGDADVFERGGIRQNVGDLVRAGDALARDAIGRKPGDVLAVEQDAPGGGAQHAGQAVEEGAFPCPVRPDDGADLALRDVEVDIIEGDQATETNGQAFGAQQSGRGSFPAGTGREAHVNGGFGRHLGS